MLIVNQNYKSFVPSFLRSNRVQRETELLWFSYKLSGLLNNNYPPRSQDGCKKCELLVRCHYFDASSRRLCSRCLSWPLHHCLGCNDHLPYGNIPLP